ncbi:MAG: hypothetical protein HY049_00770 [Acidobacteria bacterium]|nr:hypothetical protein [Acidobacteriota bacterium]
MFSPSPTGIVVRRELVLRLARVEPRVYASFRDFLQAVRLADRTRLRFMKAGAPAS